MTTNSNTEDVALVVRLPRDLRDSLRQRAAMEDRSIASLVRLAVRSYLADEQEQRL